MQPDLFPGHDTGRPDWVRHPGPCPRSSCGAWWHHPSGWIVQHCGHPTALWPWYGLPPGGNSSDRLQLLLTGGFGLGLAFRRAADCKAAVL
jgi:hypothetical protein